MSNLATIDIDAAINKILHPHPGGAPRLYTDATVMQAAIDSFFSHCDNTMEPYTITGLCLALGLEHKETLTDYAHRDDAPEMSAIVKKARLRVEKYVEKLLLTARNPVGAIFWLKNFGWRDTYEVKQEVTGFLRLSALPDTDVRELLQSTRACCIDAEVVED